MKSRVKSAVSCAVCAVKQNCSATKGHCLSRTKQASKSSAFICASCMTQSGSCTHNKRSKSCTGHRSQSCTHRGNNRSKQDETNVEGQIAGNKNKKCCRKKTNLNHRCKSKGGVGSAMPAYPSTTPAVDDVNAERNSNLSRLLLQEDVRGRLSAVERMLKEVKENVIDSRQKKMQLDNLSRSTSLPEKIIRFEDEEMERSTNHNRVDEVRLAFPVSRQGGRGVSPTRSSLRSFKTKNNNNDFYVGEGKKGDPNIHRKRESSRSRARHEEARWNTEKTERSMENEYRHLDKIRDGVAELKSRHIDKNLALKQTQDRLKRVLERLESR